MDTLDTLSSGGVEAATKAARRGAMLLESSGTKAAGSVAAQAAGRGNASLLKPPGFSFLGMVSKVSGFFSSMWIMIIPPVVMKFAGWQWPKKLPVIRSILPHASKLAELTTVEVGQLAPAAAEALPVLKPAIDRASPLVTKYAQKIGQNTFGAKALQRLSETNVSNAVFGGALVVGEGANIVMTSGRRIKVLQQMQADLTPGKPAPSTYAVLMGNHLHPLVMQVRKELIGRRAALGTLVQVAGMVGNAWMMFGRGTAGFKANAGLIAKQMAFGLGTSMVGNMLTSSDTALAAYDSLHQSFAQTGKASVESYVGVIGGFAKHANDQTVQKFARQCFEEQVKPAELLRRIEVFQKSLSAKPAGGHIKAPTPTIGINTAKVNARRADQAAAARNAVSPA